MDRIVGVFGNSDVLSKPEILFYYGVFAVLVTTFVNWMLSTMLVFLKPLTCGAILLAFIRPDLIQKFLQEEYLRLVGDKMKDVYRGALLLLLKLGEQFRTKFFQDLN